MQNIILNTTNATGELNLHYCLRNSLRPHAIETSVTENEDYSQITTWVIPEIDLAQALILATQFILEEIIHSGGDDDYFDNIPGLLEEYQEFYTQAKQIKDSLFQDPNLNHFYHVQLMDRAFKIAHDTWNYIIIQYQDPSECSGDQYLFSANFKIWE